MTSEEQNCDLCVLYFVNFLEELGWATSCLCPTHLISRRPGTPGSGTERVKSDMENATRVRVELVSTQHYESGYYCQGGHCPDQTACEGGRVVRWEFNGPFLYDLFFTISFTCLVEEVLRWGQTIIDIYTTIQFYCSCLGTIIDIYTTIQFSVNRLTYTSLRVPSLTREKP